MTESAFDHEGSLASMAGVSLSELAGLDDALIEDVLDRLLPEGSETGERLWSQGGCAQ